MIKRWYKAHEPGLLAPNFDALAPEYQNLWDGMIVRVEKKPLIMQDVENIVHHAIAYRNVNSIVPAVPWAMVGMFDQMEGGGGAHTHLHNGDPLSNYTVNVPAGRPKVGHGPPFTFLESAVDALRYQGFDKVVAWIIPRVCFTAESMNGFGYRSHGIQSPYLWSYSNWYTSGKYIRDRVYDSTAVSQQVGVMPLLKMLFDTMPAANFLIDAPTPTPTPTPQPAPTPQPQPQPTPQPAPAPQPTAPQSFWDLIKRLLGWS